jgi:hypothetical protein
MKKYVVPLWNGGGGRRWLTCLKTNTQNLGEEEMMISVSKKWSFLACFCCLGVWICVWAATVDPFPRKARQGDQIGQIFAQWESVYSGQIYTNYRCSSNILGYFKKVYICVLILTKIGLGYTLGDFFHCVTHLVTLITTSLLQLLLTSELSNLHTQRQSNTEASF